MTLKGKPIFIFSFLVLLGLFVFYCGGRFLWPRFEKDFGRKLAKIDVAGKITDLSNGSPLEMVTVRVDSGVTYTNYRGQFHWEGLKSLPVITAVSPDGYEPDKRPLSCKEGNSPAFLRRFFSCSAAFVPTPETMAGRVLDAEIAKGAEEERKIDDRYNFLWSWVHPEQKLFLGDWEDLRPIFKTRERILKKLKKTTISFERFGETVYLPSWTDPVSGKVYRNVAEINIRRREFGGRTSESKVHLARSGDNIWYYFLPFSRGELINYIEANSWVLRVRD